MKLAIQERLVYQSCPFDHPLMKPSWTCQYGPDPVIPARFSLGVHNLAFKRNLDAP